MNKDIHGYYVVNNQKFHSKVQALICASELLNKINEKISESSFKIEDPKILIKWNFNDEIFQAYNWKIEPEEDLDTLYHRRALQLRQKYDHIIVYYSGGSDSHNMIMSFLNQNLFIDEIIVHHVNSGIKILENLEMSNVDARIQPLTETKLQLFPRLKEISSLSPKTKIKIFDTTNHTIENFSNKQDESWVLNVREELNPIDSAKYNFVSFDEYKTIVEKNEKIGILVGLDKPRLKIRNKKIHLCFTDRIYNMNLFYPEIEKYSNAQIEFFYSSPDACDLICKQSHALKKWVLSSKQNILSLTEDYDPDFFEKTKEKILTLNRLSRLFFEENARLLLYPNTWKKDWFQAKKSTLNWNSEADLWFHNRFDANSLHGSCWRNSIRYVRERINEQFLVKFDDTTGYDGFCEYSKYYEIGNI